MRPTFFEVAHATDAGDDGQENDKRDEDLDGVNESVAEEFHPDSGGGSKLPQQHGGYQGNKYEQGQMAGKPG